MLDITLQEAIFRIAAFLVVTAIHGLTLAGFVRVLGDRGPAHDGRLTLNPFNHLDVLGLASAILFRVGWIRPIAIDAGQMRPGRLGLVICVIGSLLLTLLLTSAFQLLRLPALQMLPTTQALWAIELINTITRLGVGFCIFNLIPLPPLTGGHLLAAIVPRAEARLTKAYLPMAAVMIAVLALTDAGGMIQRAYAGAATFLPWL